MLDPRISRILPGPVRKPLRLAWQASQASFYYLRGKKILLDYSRHYRRARRVFIDEGGATETVIPSVRQFGVRVFTPGGEDNLISLPYGYLGLVDRVAESARPHFNRPGSCSFFPALPGGSLPERTDDIPAVRNGEVIVIQLKNPLDIDGLEDLCRPIMRELERKVYGAYVTVEKVYLYRSPVSRQTPRVSWQWHFDNHPYEVLKVMVYLSDVDERSAPFEYLRRAGRDGAAAGAPIAPLYGHSRISTETLTRHLASGFTRHKVVGPKGTMIVFDNDVIHRGNLASEAYRDVLIFQVRPITTRLRPYVDPRWTGSFQHADFNPNPEDVKPSLQKPRNFSRQAPGKPFD